MDKVPSPLGPSNRTIRDLVRTPRELRELLSDCLPVTLATAQLAFKIQEATPTRLPNSDALIAATASIKGATLIHRGPHFLPIPSSMLSQAALLEK